jgi:transposase
MGERVSHLLNERLLDLYQPAVSLTHVGDSQGSESLNLWGPILEGFVMGSAIGLRDDFDGAALRRLARSSTSANQARRLLALAQIYDGSSRSEAAKIGGVTLQIVRDWVIRFNARGPDGLLDGKAPGKRPILTDAQREALVEIVEQGPIPAIHGVVRWRLIDLVQWLHDEFAVSLDETTVGRELRKLGYVKLTARPRHHAQNEQALEAFKKGALQTRWQRSGQASQRARL